MFLPWDIVPGSGMVMVKGLGACRYCDFVISIIFLLLRSSLFLLGKCKHFRRGNWTSPCPGGCLVNTSDPQCLVGSQEIAFSHCCSFLLELDCCISDCIPII